MLLLRVFCVTLFIICMYHRALNDIVDYLPYRHACIDAYRLGDGELKCPVPLKANISNACSGVFVSCLLLIQILRDGVSKVANVG